MQALESFLWLPKGQPINSHFQGEVSHDGKAVHHLINIYQVSFTCLDPAFKNPPSSSSEMLQQINLPYWADHQSLSLQTELWGCRGWGPIPTVLPTCQKCPACNAAWPWASSLTSLSTGLLICKVGFVRVSTSQAYWKESKNPHT